MRKTPVEDYLEEISTTLTEETYGRLSDAIYETSCEFDEEVASYRAENAKLRKLVRDLWKACPTDGYYCIYHCEHYDKESESHCKLEDRMRELGVVE